MTQILERYQALPAYTKGVLVGTSIALLLTVFVFWTWRGLTNDEVEAVVAQADIPGGQEITEAVLSKRKIPAKFISPQDILAKDAGLILGRETRYRIDKGSNFRWQDLQEEGLNPNQISARVPQGFRALALPFAQEGSMVNGLSAGDTIDILGSFNPEGSSRQITRTLFQKIKVLQSRPHLILLVTPEQAELLLFSKTQGNLYLSLRNHHDETVFASLPEHEFHKFLGLEDKSAVRNRATKTSTGPQILPLPKRRKSSR